MRRIGIALLQMVIASCAGTENQPLVRNYTLPPFKIGLPRETLGGALLIERFRVQDARTTLVSSSTPLQPPTLVPLMQGVPPISPGETSAHQLIVEGRPNFDPQHTTAADVCARYIGRAIRNAGLFDTVVVAADETNEKERVATDSIKPDYILRTTMYPDSHKLWFGERGSTLGVLVGVYDSAAPIITKHVMSFDFEFLDSSGRRLFLMPASTDSSFGFSRGTKKNTTVTMIEYLFSGYREILSVCSDYLCENISQHVPLKKR